MKRIGFITDRWGSDNIVDAALRELEGDFFSIETLERFERIDSVAQGVWALINLVDVVVAYATSDSSNFYYEVGLAHGLGKPVILLSDNYFNLPQDLMGQRLININKKSDSQSNIAFMIKEAIGEIDKSSRGTSEFKGPRERLETYPLSAYQGDPSTEFRTLFAYEGIARSVRFEKWFSEVARNVSGWDVIESDKNYRDANAFDLVIWNSRDDLELNALGNPIAIELKSVRAMNTSMVRNMMHRAKVSGLRSLVLVTTGINDQRAKTLLSRLRKEEGINVISLDRDDLIKVTTPDTLLYLFKEKIRELLYREEF